MTEDWERLGREVRERRQELGFTQNDVQAEGGPSTALLRGIENATSKVLSKPKRRDLERALRWPTGHVDAILAGDPLQDGLLDYERPERPRLRPVPPWTKALSEPDLTRPERSLLLDALSDVETARNALAHDTGVDITAYVMRAHVLLVELVQRSFWGEDHTNVRVLPGQASLLDEDYQERRVANEDQTLEQISEDQQQEP
ncbi:hypothetical protein ACX12M_03015 [Cellulosimicrobium cellulans]